MTSNTVAGSLLHDLAYLGPVEDAAVGPATFAFVQDFESPLTWPDLAFDTALEASAYPAASRPGMTQLLADVAQMLSERAPRTVAFINLHMKRALIRRADAIVGASSASNRALIGLCVLTNMHLPADRVLVCAEALVHESIHQYLYATELASGNFCDLGEVRTYRSPWSGNRIPLHSLVHASFVWFGLLSLWCQLAQRPHTDDAPNESAEVERALLRDRAVGIVFGFAFLAPMLRSPGFPRDAVRPDVIALIEHIACLAGNDREAYRERKVGEALAMAERGAWLPALASRLERVGRAWQ
jgi:hypothetical protein